MCSAGGHFPPHPQQDVSPDRKQYQARPYVWDQHFRREKPKSGGTTEQGAVPPTSTDVAPLKTQTEKTLPFSSASASSWRAVSVHRSIEINAKISQQWTCFWEANRMQRWPWSYTVIPTLPTHPPSSNPKLSSRDASAQLIETQEAFILPPLLSLHLPLFLSFTCTLPFSFCLFILLTQPPPPRFISFPPLSELPFFLTFLPIHSSSSQPVCSKWVAFSVLTREGELWCGAKMFTQKRKP